MKIKIIDTDERRSRIKCSIDGTYYNLPKGLIKKLQNVNKSDIKIDQCTNCIYMLELEDILERFNQAHPKQQ